MQLFDKCLSPFRNPKMALAFARWNASRIFGQPPRVRLRSVDGQISPASVGGWISFSEYWTYGNLIPRNEEQLLVTALSSAGEKPGIAFDVGTNIGIFTCRIASLGHRVHAFEPIRETFERLRENVELNRLNSLVRLNQFAVGAEAGWVNFEQPENSPGQNRLAPLGREGTTRVPVICLDDYAAVEGIPFIDFLKIDVEGMETQVIRGAKRLLTEKRVGVVLIEICPWNLEHAGSSADELLAEIDAVGYVARGLRKDGLPGEIPNRTQLAQIVSENLVLLPMA